MDNAAQTPQQPVPPTQSQVHANKPLFVIGGFLFLFFCMIVAYFVATMNNQPAPQPPVEPTQAQSSETPTVSLQPSLSIPQGWELKSSTACNLDIAVPPKQHPYSIPTGTDDIDAGRYWQFVESPTPGDRPTETEYTNIVHVIMQSEDAPGSGYVAGNVYIQCGPNNDNLTSKDLAASYEKALVGEENSVMSIKQKETVTLWGKQVEVVYPQGGMFDGTTPVYFVATDSHMYQINKVSMSTNNSIKEATDQIFTNIQFK